MEKNIPRLYAQNGTKASFIEGIVLQSTGHHTEWDPVPNLDKSIRKFALKGSIMKNHVTNSDLMLTIAPYDGMMSYNVSKTETYKIPNAPFRIDAGEHIILYSIDNFSKRDIAGYDGVADALQILDSDGNIKYQSIHKHFLYFSQTPPDTKKKL